MLLLSLYDLAKNGVSTDRDRPMSNFSKDQLYKNMYVPLNPDKVGSAVARTSSQGVFARSREEECVV